MTNNKQLSLMPKVFKLLNLEPEEKFIYSDCDDSIYDDSIFKIDQYGIVFEKKSGNDFFGPSEYLELGRLLTHPYNISKVRYRPKFGEKYYTILFDLDYNLRIEEMSWFDDEPDFFAYNLGLVFKTKNLAFNKLELLREDNRDNKEDK